MDEFSLLRYEPSLRGTWDRIVSESKNGNFLHLRDYMDYHADRFDDCSLVALRDGEAVAVLPCNRVGDTVASHGGLTYGGLLYGQDLRAAEVLRLFEQIVLFYRGLGMRTLVYKVVPHVFHRYPAEEDQYALFRLGARLVRRDMSSVIDLQNRIKPSRTSLQAARKAIKHGIRMKEADVLEEFHELLQQVLQKFGTRPVHSVAELRLLKQRFPHGIRLFGAFSEGELLAGAVAYDFGHAVHMQYAGNSPEGRKIGALNALYEHLIDVEFASRRFFSFGISTEHGGTVLNEGLIQWKEFLGGRGMVHDFYEIDLVSSPA